MNSATTESTIPSVLLPAPIKYAISGLILLMGLGATFGLYMLKKPPADKKQEVAYPHVDVFHAESYEGDIGIEVSGVVIPHKEIKVAAEVGGKIDFKSDQCQAGQIVNENDPLLRIEKTDYELDLKQAEADYKQAQQSYNELLKEIEGAKKTRDLAEKEYKLQQQEYQRRLNIGAGVLSTSELEQSKRSMLAAEQGFETAKNSLSRMTERKTRLENGKLLAKAKVDKAQLNLDRCDIKAPIHGVIVSDMVEQGDFVNRGTQMFVIEDTTAVEIQCSLRPDQVQWLWENSSNPANRSSENPYELPKTRVVVSSNFGDDEQVEWIGELTSFDGIGLDERTKMVPCRVIVKEPVVMNRDNTGKRALIRGMFVNVQISLEASAMSANGQKFIKFPAVAVQPGNWVWTVKDGKLNRYRVKIADRMKNEKNPNPQFEKFVILRLTSKGIQQGEKVVLTPMAQAEIGSQVKENKRMEDTSVEDSGKQSSAGKSADRNDVAKEGGE